MELSEQVQLSVDRSLRNLAAVRGVAPKSKDMVRKMIRSLLDAGANPQAIERDCEQNHLGIPTLLLSVKANNWIAFETLLPISDLGARCPDGVNAIMGAGLAGEAGMLARLLALSDPSQLTNKETGSTALHAACFGGEPKCIKMLLPHCDSAALDGQGRNGLHCAAMFGSAPALALMLPHCDPLLTERSGRTAWMMICRANSEEGMALLRPVSDLLRPDADGKRGSDHARRGGHDALGQRLASEEQALEQALALRASLPQKRSLNAAPARRRL